MKKIHLLAGLFVALPLIYTALTWAAVPSIVPLRYDFDGEVEKTGPKAHLLAGIFLLTGVNGLVYLLLCNVHRIKTRLDATPNRGHMQRMALGVTVFITVVQLWILYHVRTGATMSSLKFLLVCLGLLFSFLGNYMHSIKPNHFAGFRLPWTLNDSDNWRLTHHFASRVWFAGGLLCALLSLLLPHDAAIFSFGTLLLVMLTLPFIYSYRVSKRAKTRTI